MLINPQEFVIEVPDLHPLSLDYVNYWRTAKQRCIEGHWLGGYYMPPSLYFYVNYGTILLNKKRSNVKSASRPRLRDLEWMFFQAWTEARGFSGFEGDEEYSGCYALLDPSMSRWELEMDYPHTINSEGNIKKFIHPRTLLSMRHEYHKGRPVYENDAFNLMLMGSRDTGKAITLDTSLPTLSGNILMKDIKIGDRILSVDGRETEVLGVYPQGRRQVYKLIFSDGRELKVDRDHINHLYDVSKRSSVNISTEDILPSYKWSHIRSGNTYRYSLPEIEPIQHQECKLPIDPYVVGVLIGDGTTTTITPKVATEDQELLENLKQCLPGLILKKDTTNCNYTLRIHQDSMPLYGFTKKNKNPIRAAIQDLGLDVRCKNKFIPDVYLRASYEQRLSLLQGLLDTDGSVTSSGSIEFCSVNEKLALQVIDLCRSMSIRCQLGKSKGTGYSKEEYYRVYINTNKPVFRLTRKLNRVNLDKKVARVSLINIVDLGKEEVQCIKVDHPTSLFLAGSYIPTHNTYMVGIGVVLHQWLINGATIYNEDTIYNPKNISLTVGAELAHYSNNMMVKTKFGYDNLPGTKVVNGRRYPSPLLQQYKGSWGPGSKIEATYRKRHQGGWEDAGSFSTIYHRTFRDNPYAEQGTRPVAIVLEEIGMFSNLEQVYSNTKDNLREGLRKTGTLMMLGTGGDMASGTIDAARMFYEPEAYDILPFDDQWEHKGKIGFFIPAYLALNEHKDDQGFTNIDRALVALAKARDKAKTGSGGSEALNKEIQYRPNKPSEMFLSKTANIFPATELRNRLSEVTDNNIYDLLEKKVELYFDPTAPHGVSYKIDPSLTAISKFPWKDPSLEGAVVIYELPYQNEGYVPSGAYVIGCDPYKDNTNAEHGSFASIYVMKTAKHMSTVGHNEIVATYIGRPYAGVNQVNEILHKLALFYNAKIYFENAVGNIKDYFEKIKRLDLLAKQPTTVFNKKASYNTNETIIYGYPMSNQKVKWEALQYVRSWLLEERENGKRNLDLIPDRFLLQQLIAFNLDGNFDAVMGLVGCVIGLEEIHNTSVRSTHESVRMTELEKEFENLIVNNKRLFR